MNPVVMTCYGSVNRTDGTTIAYKRSDAPETVDMSDTGGVRCQLIILFISVDDGGGDDVTTEMILSAIDADLAAYNESLGL